MAVLENLEENVEHVVMRLLDLIQQHHAIGFPAHGLCELPALFVADIARRCADKPGHCVLFHVFAHVDTHDVVLGIEQRLGKRLCKLRLSDTGRTQEEERSDRAARILNSGA